MDRINTAGSRIIPTDIPTDDVPSDMAFLAENLKSKIEKLNQEGCKPNHNQLQVRFYRTRIIKKNDRFI